MANYRSLVPGGYFSSDPLNKNAGPVSIRMNNPGAINGAAWERTFPGYVGEIETTPGNNSTYFETPEHGVAAWYELMRKYRAKGADTIDEIITRYGGTGQDYSNYVTAVTNRMGVRKDTVIDLNNDTQLLKFARAMFQHEAGRESPLRDNQILYGFQLARNLAKEGPPPVIREAPTESPSGGVWMAVLRFFASLFGGRKASGLVWNGQLKVGSVGSAVKQLQLRLIEWGYSDLNPDGEFGEITEAAVKEFQDSQNLDPNGEVDQLTIDALNKPVAIGKKPPLLPPSEKKYGEAPSWYKLAEKDIGRKEEGVNRGTLVKELIADAKTGSMGDPYCAIGANAKLEKSGVKGTRSPAARSFETSPDFIKLKEPALGCIVTMWRNSISSGQGHVFFYDGENEKGIRGIGYNEDDSVKRSFHEARRVTGYWWPKSVPLPTTGRIRVNSGGTVAGSEV